MDLKSHIRHVPDFPKPGILFYDIGTLLAHGPAWGETIDSLAACVREDKPDVLMGIESRGFLVAAPLAAALGLGIVMIRKKGKLPGKTVSYSYDLEYGSATLEMHVEDIKPKSRFLIVDDLIATGGTINATCDMIRMGGAEPVRAFSVVGLPFLNYRETVSNLPIDTLIEYFGE